MVAHVVGSISAVRMMRRVQMPQPAVQRARTLVPFFTPRTLASTQAQPVAVET